jgi:hypothetical protein
MLALIAALAVGDREHAVLKKPFASPLLSLRGRTS